MAERAQLTAVLHSRPGSERALGIVLFLALLFPALGTADPDYRGQRREMVREIVYHAKLAFFSGLDRPIQQRVLEAMGKVPRHELVPAELRVAAYDNRPLAIGYGQTISQPYIVALMTDLLEVGGDSKVLEVGTGSGYQAAVLAEIVDKVYSLEIIPELALRAGRDLERLGYDNVISRQGDGYYGWKEHGPFDGIVVTAAASHIPPSLIHQLRPGGRLVIPVGGRFMTQELTLVEKTLEGQIVVRQLLPVVFVPLTGEHDR